MPNFVWTRRRIVIATSSAAVLLFALLVWPTLYYYPPKDASVELPLMRINRITGTPQAYMYGTWVSTSPTEMFGMAIAKAFDGANSPLSSTSNNPKKDTTAIRGTYGKPLVVQDVSFKVLSCSVGEPKDDQHHAMKSSTIVTIEIANQTPNRKIEYYSFYEEVTFTDNFGNTYRPTRSSYNRPAGSVIIESIYPGKSIRDVLLFEPLISKVEWVEMSIPAYKSVPAQTLVFRIPRSSILNIDH